MQVGHSRKYIIAHSQSEFHGRSSSALLDSRCVRPYTTFTSLSHIHILISPAMIQNYLRRDSHYNKKTTSISYTKNSALCIIRVEMSTSMTKIYRLITLLICSILCSKRSATAIVCINKYKNRLPDDRPRITLLSRPKVRLLRVIYVLNLHYDIYLSCTYKSLYQWRVTNIRFK